MLYPYITLAKANEFIWAARTCPCRRPRVAVTVSIMYIYQEDEEGKNKRTYVAVVGLADTEGAVLLAVTLEGDLFNISTLYKERI